MGRRDGQALERSSRPPATLHSPVPRYGALSGLYGPTQARSPSTERRGRAFLHREPSLRCVATAKRASRAATDAWRRAAPLRRTEIRPFSPTFAAKVPSITPNFPNLGEFRMLVLNGDYRTYSDYMKLAEFGNLTNFT